MDICSPMIRGKSCKVGERAQGMKPNLQLPAKQPKSKDANSLLDHDVFNEKEQEL